MDANKVPPDTREWVRQELEAGLGGLRPDQLTSDQLPVSRDPGRVVYVPDLAVLAVDTGSGWLMLDSLLSANQQVANVTVANAAYVSTTEGACERLVMPDAGAWWAAGWRPKFRLCAFLECGGAAQQAFARITLQEMAIDDSGATTWGEAAEILETSGSTAAQWRDSGWVDPTFSPAISEAAALGILQLRSSAGANSTVNNARLHVRWLHP